MVFERLRKLISQQTRLDEDEINIESSFEDDLRFDDLDMIDLIFAAEDEFNIKIDSGSDFGTVGEMVQCIQNQLG
ncbi:MAG TPA: acyl carrier protein [Ruminiclostridium sp.]|nr:acyl carrier protein [Ruminiclostridium sp.]